MEARKISISLIISFQATCIQAKEITKTNLNPFYYSSSYGANSLKSEVKGQGIYADFTKEASTASFSYEKVNVLMKDGAEYVQSSYTGGYSKIDKELFKSGLTYNQISSDDNYIWSSYSITGTIGKYESCKSYLGLDMSYSNFTPATGDKVSVLQISPLKEWFGESFSLMLNPSVISINGLYVGENASNQTLQSMTISPKVYIKKLNLGVSYTLGKERFSVKKSGFLINNSPDLVTEQRSAFAGLNLKKLYIGTTVGQNKFISYGGNDEESNEYISFSINFSF